VRLALFAEMVKGRPWTPATLKSVGGTEGVGVAFLEETFSSSVASPKNRLHQRAARAVLKALLPETGSDIRGNVRTHAELLQASGYATRPNEFEELLHTLDSELRLVTPTEPEGLESGGSEGEKYYQLTHDYLVPSLRDWLTRKERESLRGRANLRLAGLAAQWSAFPAKRQLPTWWEWANIRLFTRKADWTPPQRKMMQKASRYHAVRGLLVAACLILVGVVGWEVFGRLKAHALRDRLLDASPSQVPAIVQEMALYRRWLDPLLINDPLLREDRLSDGRLQDDFLDKGPIGFVEPLDRPESEADSDYRKIINLRIALLPKDQGQVKYLYLLMLVCADSDSFYWVRESLIPYKDRLVPELWTGLEEREWSEGRRFRAACALAKYDPYNPKWEQASAEVAEQILRMNLQEFFPWGPRLMPVREAIKKQLARVAGDVKRDQLERDNANQIVFFYTVLRRGGLMIGD
jgi:hypothetical protein